MNADNAPILATTARLSRQTPLRFARRRLRREVRHSPAFTLIELLTVIVIIGILAAILIPVVSRVRESARKAQCISNLRQCGTAILLFTQENRSRFPVGTDYGKDVFGIRGSDGGYWGWYSYIAPYTNMKRSGTAKVKIVPSCPVERPDLSSDYQYWHNYTGYSWNKQLGYAQGGVAYCKRLENISAPTRTPMLWEALQYSEGQNPYDGAKFIFPHGNTANILMVDGHVLPFKPQGTNSKADYPEFVWTP
ncbi:N-terminal cleavage protein [Opitutaceae bacterium TAV5]|nr:N-terminal cleavage protein [Opitutaceae bacterium TAV5]